MNNIYFHKTHTEPLVISRNPITGRTDERRNRHNCEIEHRARPTSMEMDLEYNPFFEEVKEVLENE